jgi:hypothetical protein
MKFKIIINFLKNNPCYYLLIAVSTSIGGAISLFPAFPVVLEPLAF